MDKMIAAIFANGSIAQSNSMWFKTLSGSFVNNDGNVKIQPRVICVNVNKVASVKTIPIPTPRSLIVGITSINLFNQHKSAADICRTRPCDGEIAT